MTELETFRTQEALAYDLNQIIVAKLHESLPVETLSTRGNKLLQVMEEPSGERFVARSFTPEAVRDIEQSYSYWPFRLAWNAFNNAFRDVGIEVARGHLIETGESDYPFVAVSEYLKDIETLKAAPTEVKKSIAGSMGKLVVSSFQWLPGQQSLNKDMFGVTTDEAETTRVVVTDLDPHVFTGQNRGTPAYKAWYINTVGELFWDHWCLPEEREQVFGALTKSVSGFVVEEVKHERLGSVAAALQNLRIMSSGVNAREFGVLVYPV